MAKYSGGISIISIHALRVEGDSKLGMLAALPWYISIHALRVEGDVRVLCSDPSRQISIHALRVEGDLSDAATKRYTHIISIHALRVEGDNTLFRATTDLMSFQSTPSVWRATAPQCRSSGHCCRFQSTPSVWRATKNKMSDYIDRDISIHALRVEGDRIRHMNNELSFKFQSTPSVWRATAKIYKYATLCLYIVHIKLYIFATAVLFT